MPTQLPLDFHPRLDGPALGKELRDGLSAALQVADTLWVANDESASIERLTLRDGRAREHVQYQLRDYLALPDPGERDDTPEIDIEGLDWSEGYLWLTGSHSRKRCKPALEEGDSPAKSAKQLARIETEANRFLLARIPIAARQGLPTLLARDGKRRSAQLAGGTDANALTRHLRKDPHLGPYLALPGKDNGFDVEGLAVVGERLFLGLRGPVPRGWAVILQLAPREADKGVLELASVGRKEGKVRKHFLDLGGLGVRDLCAHGDDLLVLAGPTMQLDGPVKVLRWRGGVNAQGPCMVAAADLEELFDLPCGLGCDHAEGMALFRQGPDAKPSLLVVHDSPAPERQQGESTLLADVYELR